MMTNNLVLLDKLILLITSAVSDNCGITALDTKLPMSIVSKPTSTNDCKYLTLRSVGINSLMLCIASLGHSIILIFGISIG